MAANTIRFTATQPPTIAMTGGATAVTKDETPTISGTTTAAVGRTVTVKINGQVLTTTVTNDSTWSVTAAALTAGTYSVVASVRDAEGNGASANQSLTVEINPAPVVLGDAASYSLLAGTGVVNTGTTTLSGDLGLSPGGSISGGPTVAGATHDKDAAAAAAQTASVTAYNEVNARAPHRAVVGNLGGKTLHAGIYYSAAALALTGTLTLDAEGNPNAVFIFQTDGALDTAASSNVVLINGASAANVYWQAEGAVGTGADSTFRGTILTAGAVTLGNNTKLIGRALSTGTVTMANNTIRFIE
jgi:hypothetical protein